MEIKKLRIKEFKLINKNGTTVDPAISFDQYVFIDKDKNVQLA